MSETTFDCPACMPEDRQYCSHSEAAMPLAKALAMHFQQTEEPTREQVGWFLDDADALLKDAGRGPYIIRKLVEGWHSEHAFLLNNLVVTLGEGGKDCPATPEVVAKFPPHSAIADRLREWADVLTRGSGMVPAVDVAWKLRQIAGEEAPHV